MSTIDARFRSTQGQFELDAAFSVPSRGVTALFGASGSGKTTLLRLIAGLTRAPGSLIVNGEVWQDAQRFVPPHRRALGYVFQEASLFPHLSVRANLEYGWKRVPPAERTIRWDEVIEWLGLAPLIAQRPHQLSGGQRQRVAIGRALLSSPRLLLMDEPLAALDASARADILPYLDQLHRALAIPLLYVSHAVDEVARLADHLVCLEAGRVVWQGEAAAGLPRLGVMQAHAARVLAREADMTVLDIAGQTLRLPGLAAEPGDLLQLRFEKSA
ncbi:MAG TPA: molybdenum ABC transporter ATP-binding protein [Steroidobacteraceae bacterium]|nr:molybdenum ABC transporter ATP-binding protein [Steroidobacteraceae bacterium]